MQNEKMRRSAKVRVLCRTCSIVKEETDEISRLSFSIEKSKSPKIIVEKPNPNKAKNNLRRLLKLILSLSVNCLLRTCLVRNITKKTTMKSIQPNEDKKGINGNRRERK